MLSVSEFLIEVYVLIDDLLKTALCGVKLRRRGKPPKLSDAEVLTMEVVGEFLGRNQDKSIWQYFSRHWRHFFPDLPSRTRFVRQAADLWHVKQLLQALLADQLAARATATIHVVDAFPIRLCRLARARRCRLFRGEAATGYCASQKEWYYGFKGHLLVNDEGVIAAGSVTGANIDDREGLEDVLDGVTGVVIGDKGYIDWEFSIHEKPHTGYNAGVSFGAFRLARQRHRQYGGYVVAQSAEGIWGAIFGSSTDTSILRAARSVGETVTSG